MSNEPIESLAERGANVIHAAFLSYRAEFNAITCRARVRFEQRDWHGMQDDALERLELYKKIVDGVVAETQAVLGAAVKQEAIWLQMKACYSRCIAGYGDFEIAETFFNSITRRIFATVGVDPGREYVDSDFNMPPARSPQPVYFTYTPARTTADLLRRVMADYAFAAAYADLDRDVHVGRARRSKRSSGGWPRLDRNGGHPEGDLLSQHGGLYRRADSIGRAHGSAGAGAAPSAGRHRDRCGADGRERRQHRLQLHPIVLSRRSRTSPRNDRVPQIDPAVEARGGVVHLDRLQQARQDRTVPRPAAPSGRVHRQVRDRARRQGHGDAGLRSALVRCGVQDHQGSRLPIPRRRRARK